MQVIIRHLEREARIRDLFITCLSIKEASENITNNAQVNPYYYCLTLIPYYLSSQCHFLA